jgi:hypothetical protein
VRTKLHGSMQSMMRSTNAQSNTYSRCSARFLGRPNRHGRPRVDMAEAVFSSSFSKGRGLLRWVDDDTQPALVEIRRRGQDASFSAVDPPLVGARRRKSGDRFTAQTASMKAVLSRGLGCRFRRVQNVLSKPASSAVHTRREKALNTPPTLTFRKGPVLSIAVAGWWRYRRLDGPPTTAPLRRGA